MIGVAKMYPCRRTGFMLEWISFDAGNSVKEIITGLEKILISSLILSLHAATVAHLSAKTEVKFSGNPFLHKRLENT